MALDSSFAFNFAHSMFLAAKQTLYFAWELMFSVYLQTKATNRHYVMLNGIFFPVEAM